MNKTLLATLLFAPLLATAATPSFDCAKAKGAAETLICKDAELAALDNELAALYPKAIAAFSPEQQKTERAIQRGWLKGRNDCWKAGDLRQCVKDSYQLRITELQIKGGQLMVPAPVNYLCGKHITLSTYFYNEAKRPAAVINPTRVLTRCRCSPMKPQRQRCPLSRAKPHPLHQGGEATLERVGQPTLSCTQR